MSGVKLFRAYTVRENYKDRDSVIVDWYCEKRAEPVAPYETLIANYDELDDDEKRRARTLVNRFLTGPEVRELAAFMMAQSGFSVHSREAPLPFADGRKIPDIAAPAAPGAEGDTLRLSQSAGYDLSVPISGFCDLSEPPNLVSGTR